MAKVIIEALNSPSIWRYPQTTGIKLRIYANVPFQTLNGQYIGAGSPKTPNSLYLEVACDIQGGNILYIPSFEIDSTEDSPTDRTATYTAWLFAGDEQLGNVPFVTGFSVPEVPAVQTWTSLILHRDSFNPPPRQGVYDVGVVEYKISEALALRHLGTVNDPGMLALQDPPINPALPIALGPNSPGVVRAVGTGADVLVAGEVKTVLSGAVLSNSLIKPIGIADTITGNLRAFNKIPGASFDVVSDNGADEGAFGWVIW